MRPSRAIPRRRPRVRAFTLVEAAIAVLIMGVLMGAALQTVGAAGMTRAQTAARARGRMLADAMVLEITAQAYQEPGGAAVFGREAGEAASPRTGYDDVDDYHGLVESPPVARDGVAIAGASGLERKSVVEWVPPTNAMSLAVSETGCKRITVTVRRKGVILAKRVVLRTSAGGWP